MVFPTTTSALLCALLSTAVSWTVRAPQSRTASEHDVKAAFLYNFTRFVSWPSGIPPGSEPFRICVVADRDTTAAVERAMAGEAVQGRPAEMRVPTTPAEVKSCQLLFIGRSAENAGPLMAAARQAPVLVVGDGEEFPERGGAIGFVLVDGKVKFDIHLANAERSGLSISSRLLGVARRTDVAK
jgi:hypothetical protein